MPINQNPIKHTRSILIVDDETASLRLLTDILSTEGYKVRPTERPQSVLESAGVDPPDLILLDVRMPEISGFELSRQLKQDERTKDIPIIFVSGLQDIEDKIQGFEAGGVDFISKPFQEAEILARVKTHLQLRCMQLQLEDLVAERTADLVQANKEMRENERRFRATFEQAAVGIAYLSLEGCFLRVNQKFCDIVGYSNEEMLRRTFQEMTHPDDLDADLEALRRFLAGESDIYTTEKRYFCKNGGLVWVHLTTSLVQDEENKPEWFVSVIEDITKVKQLQDERDRILELSQDMICSVGLDGYFKYLNPAWEKILGYTVEELMSRPFLDFVHPDDRASTIREFESLVEGRWTIDFENRYTHRDGSSRHLSWKVTPLLDEKRLYAAARDITERKHAEQELRQYQHRLKALASQLTISEEQERRRIAADLHDHVGQSLALAHLQIASVRKLVSDPRQTDTLDAISDSLSQTVQDTRDLIYDLSPPQLHEIGLSAAILEWLEEHVEKRYKIKTECIADGLAEQLDKNLRSILFRNTRELVTNVIKHSQATQVKIWVLQGGNHVKIIVRDDGIGFDAGVLIPSGKIESGYGLFSIKERMADMGGSLEIVSEAGQGTKAIMHVPITPGDAQERKPS